MSRKALSEEFKGEEQPTKRLKKNLKPTNVNEEGHTGPRKVASKRDDVEDCTTKTANNENLKDPPLSSSSSSSSPPLTLVNENGEGMEGSAKKETDDELIVKCQNDEQIIVSPKGAASLKARSVFFRNAFRHGTKESQYGIIFKPDWTRETADNIVNLIVDGHCEIPLQYYPLQQAAAQILIGIRVRHPLLGHDISSDTETVENLSSRWARCKSRFTLETPLVIDGVKWKGLLDSGVVIVRDEKQLIVEAKEIPESIDDRSAEKFQNQKLLVGASTPLCVSVYHTCYFLSAIKNTQQPQEPGKAVFLLAFRAQFGAGVYLQQVLGKNVKFCDGQGFEKIFYTAPAKKLLQVLKSVEDFIIPPKICMLWAAKPDSWTLGQMIRASQLCDDYPATLAWNVKEYSFSALKTIRDIRSMLTTLSNPSTPAATSGSIHIKDQSVASWEAF
jgi:hypothetical protein